MHTLMVGNVPGSLDDAQFRQLLAPYGRVEHVMTSIAPFSRVRRAFIDMADAESASRARQALHGREIDGHALTVEIYYLFG